MAIARISDCQAWHREYCELYWRLNEYQLVGLMPGDPDYDSVSTRMYELTVLLGYVPEA